MFTQLDQNGFESRHIMNLLSGHKSESSLKSYSRHVDENTKRRMSHTLSNAHTDSMALVPSQKSASFAYSGESDEENRAPKIQDASADALAPNCGLLFDGGQVKNLDLVLQDNSNYFAHASGNQSFSISNCVVNINYIQK